MDRQRALDEKKAAVSEAIEKTKQELQTSPAASSDDVSKKHAEELKALEAKLAKEHQAALAAAKQTQPATSQSEQATIDAAIATAVATREAEWKAGIESEIAAAVERGRVEGTTKIKLKDAQLARQMAQLKKLEAQISEWKAQGIIPDEPPKAAPATATTSAAASTSTAPAPAQPAQAKPPAGVTKPAPATAAKPALPAAVSTAPASTLPKKPTPVTAATRGRGGIVRGALRGAGRGAAPGGLSIRGQAQTADASQPAAAGMSIMGASKRTREEGESAADNALAKRLKPAEGGSRPSPPVNIRRDRVPPPS